MRLGSSSIQQNRPLSKKNIIKGILPYQFKNFNPVISDNFEILNAWVPRRGSWSTDGNKVTTSTAASNYPLLVSYDLRSQDITATLSLDSAGSGVAFWVEDENNWWAAVTFYTSGSETVTNGTSTSSTTCWYTGYWAITGCSAQVSIPYHSCPSGCGCWPSGAQNCSTSTTCNSSGRTRYNFYLRILRSVNGTVTEPLSPLLIRTTCSQSFSGSTCSSTCTQSAADNINGIQVSTQENLITVRGRDDANNFYGTAISYTAVSPVRGHRSGIIYTPGGNYLLSPAMSSISIVGN